MGQLLKVVFKPVSREELVKIGRRSSQSEDGIPAPDELGGILSLLRGIKNRKNKENKIKNLKNSHLCLKEILTFFEFPE